MASDWERGYAAGWYAALSSTSDRTNTRMPAEIPQKPKAQKTRKVSAYSKRYGREYKRLKAKHPRASFGSLSKKAHAATRKAMK